MRPAERARWVRAVWLLLILLVAAWLRLHALDDAPPGLTHDEADHGISAWGVVNGERPIYFTIGYGREPLYDYATALLMVFLGPTFLAGRLTSVFFSLVLLAGTYAWTRRAFGETVALLTAAGLAVSFWGVMTGRQMLRSVTLPALVVLAVLLFWRGLAVGGNSRRSRMIRDTTGGSFVVAGVLLGATFYTYFPARVMWGLLPLLALYAAVVQRQGAWARRAIGGTVVTLGVAAAVAAPLLYYLLTTPGVEVRLAELSAPLYAAMEGDYGPLLRNVAGGLGVISFRGDGLWRYNIPGRPLLGPVMSGLFYVGLVVAVSTHFSALSRRWAAVSGRGFSPAACFFALCWLVVGMLPVLITGPDLSITRAIAVQPVLYLFPAVGMVTLWQAAGRRSRIIRDTTGGRWQSINKKRRFWRATVPFCLFAATFALTARDYFGVWAGRPEVRVQYESALVAAVRYLNDQGSGAAAVSTTTPGEPHSPAVAAMTLTNEAVRLGWFDGRYSLLLPQEREATVILTGFAPLSGALADYFSGATFVQSLPLPETDVDRPVMVYEVNGLAMLAQWQAAFSKGLPGLDDARPPLDVGGVVEFLGYDLQTPEVAAGDTVRVATLWRVKRPVANGVIFTHVLGKNGAPLAQADRLDVPSDLWRVGDVFIQLHELVIPAGLEAGEYPSTVGIYTRPDLARLPVTANGSAVGDVIALPPVVVEEGD